MGFDQHDLLRQSGYRPGDVVPTTTLNTPVTGNSSTTSTTFEDVNLQGRGFTQLGDFTVDGTLQVALGCRLSPGTGETLSVRYRNVTDNETMVSVTGQEGTDTTEWSGWTSYSPTTTDAPIEIKYQQRVDVGSNSSTVIQPRLYGGIRL